MPVKARLPNTETQTLFYKAERSGNMWDTWLYWHEGMYYLFHLAGRGGSWYGVAMATSPDGVHWREYGTVLEKGDGVTWLGTGSVWEAPARAPEPRFILNFSEWRGDAQTIFFAESSDLLHWRRLGNEYEFRTDTRWYKAGRSGGRWDCIYTIDRPGGGRYGYWTASPLDFTGFGYGESTDGLAWQALAPPRIEWGDIEPMPTIESGAVAEIGGRYHTMLGANEPYGPYESGMFSFVADAPSGPFRPIPANYALLTSPAGRWHTYFARFFPVAGLMLVNHHVIAHDGEVYFAPLKQAVVDDTGALRLKWWAGNDTVKQSWPERTQAEPGAVDIIPYVPSDGMLIEGRLHIPEKPDDVSPEVLVGCGNDRQGTCFRIRAGGVVDVDEVTPTGDARLVERIDRGLALTGAVSFRLVLMHSFAELYLEDHLIQVHALPAGPGVRLVLTDVDGGRRIWQP